MSPVQLLVGRFARLQYVEEVVNGVLGQPTGY